MEEARLAAVEADLERWGLVEREAGMRLTRRFRGALARAVAALREQEVAEAATGAKGSASGPGAVRAVENAVRLALDEANLPGDARPGRDHVAFLTALELASLPPEVVRLMGGFSG